MRLIDADALRKIILEQDIQEVIDEFPTIEPPQPAWIDISYYRPEADSDTKYLVCCKTAKGLRSINTAWFDGAFWHGMGSMAGVTHWLPLPDLPEVGE